MAAEHRSWSLYSHNGPKPVNLTVTTKLQDAVHSYSTVLFAKTLFQHIALEVFVCVLLNFGHRQVNCTLVYFPEC